MSDISPDCALVYIKEKPRQYTGNVKTIINRKSPQNLDFGPPNTFKIFDFDASKIP